MVNDKSNDWRPVNRSIRFTPAWFDVRANPAAPRRIIDPPTTRRMTLRTWHADEARIAITSAPPDQLSDHAA
jgi:hypothetical protein